MTKSDTLREIATLVESHEAAIASHPLPTSQAYLKGRDAFLSSDHSVMNQPALQAIGLSVDELAVVRRFMLASSFISAWYHLQGDEAQRDNAAHSCVTLVAGLGGESDQVMRTYIGHEQLWRREMEAEAVVSSRWRTPSAVALAYPLLVAGYVSGRAPLMVAIASGLSQLGYVVGFSGLLFGSFRVFGIRSRIVGIGVGGALLVIGALMVNL